MEGLQATVWWMCAVGLWTTVVTSETGDDVPYEMLSDELAGSRYGNLSCYDCALSLNGENCYHLIYPRYLYTRCLADQTFCMVERYSTQGEQKTFMRKCAKECVPGCQKAGKYYIIEKCYSCCQDNLCNTDFASAQRTVAYSVVSLAGYVTFTFIIFH